MSDEALKEYFEILALTIDAEDISMALRYDFVPEEDIESWKKFLNDLCDIIDEYYSRYPTTRNKLHTLW